MNNLTIEQAREYAKRRIADINVLIATFKVTPGDVFDQQVLRSLLSITAPSGWQDIATAPKDGTQILLWFPQTDMVIRGCWEWAGEGDWESGIQDWQEWRTDHDVEDPSFEPSHWMPLPSPPVK